MYVHVNMSPNKMQHLSITSQTGVIFLSFFFFKKFSLLKLKLTKKPVHLFLPAVPLSCLATTNRFSLSVSMVFKLKKKFFQSLHIILLLRNSFNYNHITMLYIRSPACFCQSPSDFYHHRSVFPCSRTSCKGHYTVCIFLC